jgi:gamma-glutamyltranspeptidase/glutathione hydrolase
MTTPRSNGRAFDRNDLIRNRPEFDATFRPVIRGTHAVISAGHHLAAQAGYEVLRAGGNAIDAGVAAGFVLNVVMPHQANLGGEAPIFLYSAARGEVANLDGNGRWPRAASVEYFLERHDGKLPATGPAAGVVPAALDAWLTALAWGGTMEVADVVEPARRLAADGFVANEEIHDFLAQMGDGFFRDRARMAAILAPGGRLPRPGDLIVQPALARLLGATADASRTRAARTREQRIAAARDFFYEGEPAAEMAAHCASHGGWITREDMSAQRVRFERPVIVRVWAHDVYTCGPWSQGPVLAQTLKLLEALLAPDVPHGGAAYFHAVLESLKLAFADREAFCADPDFVDVPIDALTSDAYLAERRRLFDPRAAWDGLPPPGRPGGRAGWERTVTASGRVSGRRASAEADTTYLAVMDADGNAFSATPSGTGDWVPSLGISVSSRGRQSLPIAGHPNEIAGGKRPRITPNPALVMRGGRPVMAVGTPGGDVQPQAMAQAIVNVLVYGMDAQRAVEAPRAVTYSMPVSFYPNVHNPGWIAVEESVPATVIGELEALGHRVAVWPALPRKSAVCAVRRLDNGALEAGADIRGDSQALGW